MSVRLLYWLCRFASAAWIVLSAAIAFAQSHASSALPLAPEGFQVELLRSASDSEGSWISMTFDNRGRLIFGRDDAGLTRITLAKDANEITSESIDAGSTKLRHCRGVLYANDSLYVVATDSNALYRLKDIDGDDRFEDVKLLKNFDYRSRYGHGANQMTLGPDGSIYVVVGNDVSFPDGMKQDSPYRDPRNDWLLPNPHDAGHDNRVGYIARIDAEAQVWEVLAGGFRNPVDVAFNSEGEMFTYDADMEWDVGMPWYRPTRVNHVTSAGEYGWRWGTGKWPTYYADSLPTTLDTGLGSPTGLEFGYRGRFPEKYRNGLFLGDWQNGRILIAHLQSEGASYAGEYEVFIQGAPMNVCDLTFGSDGAMYFITGGRGSQSALYRVRYVGDEAVEPNASGDNRVDSSGRSARNLRRSLEAFHTNQDPRAVTEAWPHLDAEDRWLRYAARLAIERQDVSLWRSKALRETRSTAAATALLALARVGETSDQPDLLTSLNRLPFDSLDHQALFTVLRAYALSFIRQGKPSLEIQQAVERRLASLYPHENALVNQELCELLVYLESTVAIDRTLDLLESSPSQELQIHYAQALLHARNDWSLNQRLRFFSWLKQTQRFRGGKLLATVLQQMKTDFVQSLSDDEQQKLASEITSLERPISEGITVSTRPFVRQWSMEDFASELDQPLQGRSLTNAKAALAAGSCLKCHQIGHEGAAIGPDLSHVGRRYDLMALLQSIIHPSQVIDPKYCDTAYILNDGKVIVGRPIQVDANKIVVETNPLTQATATIARASIEASQAASVSPMPTGLADVLTRDELLDLLAYLKSGGVATDPVFQAGR